jgi:hypothetical protein
MNDTTRDDEVSVNEGTPKIKKKSKILKAFSIYCSSTSASAVVSMVCSERGWRTTPDPKKASVLWCSDDELNLLLSSAKRYQRFAKIPGMDVSRCNADLVRKALIISCHRSCAPRNACHAPSIQRNGSSRTSSISGQSHGLFLNNMNHSSKPWTKLKAQHL